MHKPLNKTKHITTLSQTTSKSLNKNEALIALFVYNGIFVMAASMLGPLYAIYVVKFVDGIMAVSISWAAFLASTSFFTFLVLKWGDEVKEKKYLLLAGYAIRIFSWLSMIFVHNLWPLILVQILLGLGEALGSPSFNAIFAKHLDKNKYISEYSVWLLIANLTSAVGIILGGIIVNNFNFATLFLLMSFFSLIAFLGVLLKPKKIL